MCQSANRPLGVDFCSDPCNTNSMKNTHIEHPEDNILDGKDAALNVIDFLMFTQEGDIGNKVSLKWDGSPAIVFGTNPENGKFFVGTKSVFNKKTPKLNYTVEDIHNNHESENVREILTLCLLYLPQVDGIYQGDYIGIADGKRDFTPNTITYRFPVAISEQLVIALHTRYRGDTIADLSAEPFNGKFASDYCYFPSVNVTDLGVVLTSLGVYKGHAYDLINDIEFPEFKTKTAKANVKKLINDYIRKGKQLDPFELSDETDIDWRFFALYNLIVRMKDAVTDRYLPNEMCQCFINTKSANHEGFVVTNSYGSFKLINRTQFSRANFNNQKFRVAV